MLGFRTWFSKLTERDFRALIIGLGSFREKLHSNEEFKKRPYPSLLLINIVGQKEI